MITFVKSIRPDIICMVDNCYGEFVQDKEPTDYGADLIAGSLIKNPGGGLAPIGGYICGKKEYVENAAYRLTTPGLGKEVGASLNNTKAFAQGLFMAPSVTASALKGAIFAANVYENLGFKTVPNKTEDRFDIIQAVELQTPEEYSREMYDEYVERRKCLIDGLNRIPGVYSPIPMGAFYTVAKLPVDDAEKFCAWCLSDFNYEGETVMMAAAAGFYTTPGAGRNEVRVAYVLKKEDLARALFVLRKALEAYPGHVDE